MNTSKTSLLIFALLSLFNAATAQSVNLTSTTCPPGVCPASNPVSFRVTDLIFDPAPPSPDADPRQRFEAFWVPGDGNYIQFDPSDRARDALSLIPTYGYSATGTYEAATYLTGKYTNHRPPARAAQRLIINAVGAPASVTPFRSRLRADAGTEPMIDIFSNHDIRKGNLTTFVISWPGDVNATGIYLFFDGYKNSRTGEYNILPDTALFYQNTDVPAYFTTGNAAGAGPFLDAAQIGAHYTAELRHPIHGVTFEEPLFNNMPSKFRQFVFIPAETATKTDMPNGFTENRLFVVLKADTGFVPQDTFMNFVVMLTGPEPNKGNDQLGADLRELDDSLSPETPVASIQLQQQSVPQSQYVQAVADLQLQYLTTFDPNELTVQDIQPSGADEYEVTFRLEMCNKGRANVEYEDVSLSFPTTFRDFRPADFVPVNDNQTATTWNFRVNMIITGVEVDPTGGYEESTCQSILFKAKTNCAGLRSLWKSEKATSVQSCVLFSGGLPTTLPECHAATGIDSTQFGCLCCMPKIGEREVTDGNCWPLWLLLILVVLFVIWWVYKQNNN